VTSCNLASAFRTPFVSRGHIVGATLRQLAVSDNLSMSNAQTGGLPEAPLRFSYWFAACFSNRDGRYVMKHAAAFAIRTGTQLAKAGCELMQLKDVVKDAAQEPVATAKRAVRKGQFAIQDCADDCGLKIRRNPLKAAGVIFGAGLGVGILLASMRRRT
jgi:ElaB/YqjD/DUF883 family membrane-anchored ribosome-binding protein